METRPGDVIPCCDKAWTYTTYTVFEKVRMREREVEGLYYTLACNKGKNRANCFAVRLVPNFPLKGFSIREKLLFASILIIYRVFKKIVFFLYSLQPLPSINRCKRPSKLSTQYECTVNPMGWYFLYNQ